MAMLWKLLHEHGIAQYNFYDGLSDCVERATTEEARKILAIEIRELARALLSVHGVAAVTEKKPDLTDEENAERTAEAEKIIREAWGTEKADRSRGCIPGLNQNGTKKNGT